MFGYPFSIRYAIPASISSFNVAVVFTGVGLLYSRQYANLPSVSVFVPKLTESPI